MVTDTRVARLGLLAAAGLALGAAPAFARQCSILDGDGPGPGSVGKYVSLAIDPAGNPHFVYFDDTPVAGVPANNLKYKAPGLAPVTIVIPGSVGKWTSCAFDSLGTLHVTYYAATAGGELRYKSRSPAGVWGPSVVIDGAGAGGPDVGQHSSLAVGWDNSVHVAYYDATNKDLRYIMRYPGGGWIAPMLVDGAGAGNDVGKYCDIGLHNIPGTNVKAHISYYDESVSHKTLKHAFGSFVAGWCVEFVDPAAAQFGINRGQWTSIAVNAIGQPRISYYDVGATALRLAWSPVIGACGGWASAEIDNTGSMGQYTSMVLSAAGDPIISYRAATGGDLKRALVPWLGAGPGVPVFTVVDDSVVGAGDVTSTGLWTCIGRLPGGGTGIAHFNDTTDDLRYCVVPFP